MTERDIIWIGPSGHGWCRWKAIARQVAESHGVTLDDVLGRSNKRPIAHARQATYAALREYTDLSLSAIGAKVGGRGHQPVLIGIRRHEARKS